MLQMWKLWEQRYSSCSSVLVCTVAASDPSDKLAAAPSSIFKLQMMNESLHGAYKSSTFVFRGGGGDSVWIRFERNMLSTLTLSPLSPPRGGFVCLKPQTAPLSFTAFPLLCFLFIPSSSIIIITPASLYCLHDLTFNLHYWSRNCTLSHRKL